MSEAEENAVPEAGAAGSSAAGSDPAGSDPAGSETVPAGSAPTLLGPAEVRELAERLGVSPTKKLGQNFVIDPNTVRKIVRLAGVTAGDHVIEVGPGLGSLTLGITETGAEVTAIEIDHRLAAELPATVAAMQPDAAHRFRVIRSDALELTAEMVAELPSPPELLVANLPYNVSVPILMELLELIPELRGGLVMVQAEVGYRIAAKPGSKEYGAPSAKAAWYGPWRIAGTVSRRIFWPVPGVDSVLVGYAQLPEPRGSIAERDLTFSLINAAFAHRRKMLRQSLQPVLGTLDEVVSLLESAGIDPTLRAEQLSVEDYLAITRARQ